MKKCLSTDSDRSGSEGTPFIVNGQDVARRFAVATLLVACLLPTVLLVGVCSYVHREMLLVDSQLRQVMRDCSYCCSHPVVSIEAVSPAQTTIVAGDQTTQVHQLSGPNVTTTLEHVDQRKRRMALMPVARRRRRSPADGDTVTRTFRRRRPRSASVTRRQGSSQRRCRNRSSSTPPKSAIHLEMFLPNATGSDLAKLSANLTIDVDFGKRHRLGFVPDPDHSQNRSLVYRVWRVTRNVDEEHFHYDTQTGSVRIRTAGLYLVYCQLQYQCERTCGYALMKNEHLLARCVAGRRRADSHNLLLSPCSVVTTAAMRSGDRLRLQDVVVGELVDTGRYLQVLSTPAETAASNFWGVVKLADSD